MARVISGGNKLERKYKLYRFISGLGLTIFVVFSLCWIIQLFMPWHFKNYIKLILFLGMPLGILLRSFMDRKAGILRSGLEGENTTKITLSALDNSYVCMSNLEINLDEGHSELDMVVVGPSGVFVVETKNLKGLIDGSVEASKWVQQKFGAKGGMTSNSFYNPVKQVSTHVRRLSELLKRNGYNVFVQGIVFFSNFETEVVVSADMDKVPVFAVKDGGESKLREYIKSSTKAKLTPEQVDNIVSFLSNGNPSSNGDYTPQRSQPNVTAPSPQPQQSNTEQDEKKFCPHCGKPQKEETPFCPYCGNKL